MTLEIPQLLSAKSPAILFSGGSDSLLLLDIALQIRPDIAVIHFYDGKVAPEVAEVISGLDIVVLSWAPSTRYLIPWNEGIALVSEYSFGDRRLPVLRDVIPDDRRCDLERLSQQRLRYFDYPYELTIWGYRKSDELHPVMPSYFPRECQLGPTRMQAPLYDWETIDVIEAVQRLPFSPVNDALTACKKCREVLKSWDRKTSLQFFAKRFGYQQEAA